MKKPTGTPGGPLMCTYGVPELNPSAWAKQVPADVLRAILSAKSILIVGDSDADGQGASVAFARTLSLLGKKATPYCETRPPLELLPLLDGGEVKSGPIAEKYDLVIHVDHDGTRVGADVKDAVSRADAELVIDHHEVKPHASPLRWVDTGADAASILVLGLIIRLTDQSPIELSDADWGRVLTPILAGIESDTRRMVHDRTRASTYGIVRYLVNHTSANMHAVMDAIDPFSYALKKEVFRLLQPQIEGEPPRRTGLFHLDAEKYAEITKRALRERSAATDEDVYHLIVGVMQAEIDGYDLDLSVAVFERPDHIKVSTRSKEEEPAIAFARAFGGNGKPGEGGANLTEPDRSHPDEVAKAARLLKVWRQAELESHVGKWRRGSL